MAESTAPRNPSEEFMRRKLITTTASILCVLFASTPGAADDYADPGPYLFLGGLTAFENFGGEAQGKFDNSLGFDMRFGWRLMDYLAAEIEGNFISGFDVDIPTQEGGTAKLTSEGGNVTFNVRGVLPMGRLEPYAVVGIGGMWSDLRTRFNTGTICYPGWYGWWCEGTQTRLGKAGSFVAKFGLGTDFWLSEAFGLTVDASYVLPTGDLNDQQYIKLGWGARMKF
jgi:opacity protein-like surface antigen